MYMKSSLIKTIIKFLMIFTSSIMFSQTSGYPPHYKKYWYFKSRLNNDFVKVGVNDGESMPFNQRGNFSTSFGQTASVDMNLGDGTGTLGYYIAVLATEYKLLQISNQNTDKIKHELFCALNAINRLDYKAESVFQNGTFNLNGFFVRDDVPALFLKNKPNYDHFNYYNNWDGVTFEQNGDVPNNVNKEASGFMSKFEKGMFKVTSDWGRNETNDPHDFSESQDQVYNLLFGLAFVNKFVPLNETDNNAVFGYGSGETSLTVEARKITDRLIGHMRNPKDLAGNPCGNPGNTLPNDWRVRNPVTCNLVPTGDNAQSFAYALAEAQCFIHSGAILGSGNINLPNPLTSCPGAGYHNAFSQTAGRVAWNVATDTYIGVPNCPNALIDNRVFVTNLSAICNCVWGSIGENIVNETQWTLEKIPIVGGILASIVGWLWQWVSTVLIYITQFIQNTTWSSILLNAYDNASSLDHGPLARKVLHGGIYQPNGNYTIDYQLDQAPCDGIYNLKDGLNSGVYWSSDNRLDHPNRSNLNASIPQSNTCTGVDIFPGEYNGIDFLLYHNLWYLHKWQQQGSLATPFINLSDVYVNKNGGTISNNILSDKSMIAYETITIEDTKFDYTYSQAYWRSGKSIYLGPGTEISPTSNLHAYIQKFDCATDAGQFRMANGDSTKKELVIEPYHYVSYPNDNNNSSTSESNINPNYITELADDEEVVKTDKITVKVGEFEVYPNPSNNTTKIYFNLTNKETAKVVVKDLTGKILIEKDNLTNTNNGNEIDLSGLALGSYLIFYSTNDGIFKSVKLIKTN